MDLLSGKNLRTSSRFDRTAHPSALRSVVRSNQLHLVISTDPAAANRWNDDEVMALKTLSALLRDLRASVLHLLL
jgi:hypothetical protein